jgi:hypothetical protein
MFVKAILARRRRPKKKPKLTASAKFKRVHFGKQVVQQELGKCGCLGLYSFPAMPQRRGDKWRVMFEDDLPTVPTYRRCTKVHVYAAVT